MSTETRKPAAETRAPDAEPHGRSLRGGTLGVVGIVFFVVAAAAPLAAVTGTSPVVFLGVNVGAPGMFLVAGLVCLLFSVGYSAASRHITSAGGFAAYISRSLSPRLGVGFALVAIASYCCSIIAVYALFGTIASDTFATVLGIDVPWQVWTFSTLVIVAILGYFEVRVANRLLGILLILEIIALAVLGTGIIAQGGADGINLDSFVPSNIFGAGTGMAFMFAFLAFLGFEATALYGEETKNPKRTVPIATYVAVIVITVVYALATWTVALGWGSSKVAEAAAADPTNFVFIVSEQFLGTPFTHAMQLLVVLSFFATLLAVHSAVTRYVFSLGRGNLLPAVVGRTHRQFRSPYVASFIVSIVCLIVLGAFTIFGADPFAVIFSWLSGVAAVGVILTEMFVSIGVIAFFRRTKLDTRPWQSLIAPALSVVTLVVAAVLAVTNYQELAGVDTPWVYALPAALPVILLIGYLVARRREKAGVDLYRGITSDDGDSDDGESDDNVSTGIHSNISH